MTGHVGGLAPVNAFIYGSCVSRDTFEHVDDAMTLQYYVARQSWISAGNDASSVRPQLTAISSKFQERMVLGDLRGDLPQQLGRFSAESDLTVIDLIDERGGVIDFSEGYATRLAEFWGAGGREASRARAHVEFGSDEHFELWKAGARRLIGELVALESLHKAVVIEAPWAQVDDDGDLIHIPDWMKKPQSANEEYRRYYDYIRDAGIRVLTLPSELAVSSKNHRWGTSPFHYAEAAYRHLAENLRKIADTLAAESRHPAATTRRDTAPWGQFTTLADATDFAATPDATGNFTVWHGDLPIDFQVEDNAAATTLVSLHAAFGKDMTPPVFTGRAISDGLGVNRVFISDPSLLTSETLGLAWYLGASTLNLTRVLRDVITAIQQRLSADHIVFFGMSGGGFASINLSRQFPGSLAVPVNPQTRVLSYAPQHWEAMARECFGAHTSDGAAEILEAHPYADQRRVYGSEAFENTVIYVQNQNDPHVTTHMIPWFESISWRGDASILLGDWGAGHVPPKGPVLRTLLQGIAGANGDWKALSDLWGANSSPTRDWVKSRTGR